ncbi:MAG: hypothetical protein KDB23_32975, partial [Planctomycetales bacterium]|nr:hypothetical protein [Planctomycetales bacterium]
AGLDTSLAVLNEGLTETAFDQTSLAAIDAELKRIAADWNFNNRTTAVVALARQLATLRRLAPADSKLTYGQRHDLKRIDRKIHNAIIALAGLDLSAWVTSTQHPEVSHAVIGDTLQLHIRLSNPSELFIETTGFAVNQAGVVQIPAESGAKQIGAGSVQEWTVDEWQVTAPPTVPHWSRENLTQPMYETRPDGEQRPLPPAPFQVSVPIVIEGQRIELTAVVQTRITHPEYGLVQYPLTVVPAICLRFPRDAGIVPQGKSAYSVPVNLRSSCKDRTVADVKLQLPPGWTCEPARKSIEFEREGDEATVVFQVQIPAAVSNQPYALTAIAESQGEQFQAGFTTVVARDLGRVNI